MSVNTKADENLDRVSDIVQEAISLMGEIVIDRCWGWDGFTEEYMAVHPDILQKLIVIRTLLK